MDITKAQGQETTKKLKARYTHDTQSEVIAPGITASSIAAITTEGV